MFPHSRRSSQKASSSSGQSLTSASGSTSSSSSTSLPIRSSTASLETALQLLRQERKQVRNGNGNSASAYRQLLVTPTKGAQAAKTARKKVKAKTVKPSSTTNDDLDGQEADVMAVVDVDADDHADTTANMEDDELDAEGEDDETSVQPLHAELHAVEETADHEDSAAPKQNVAVCVRVRSTDKNEEAEMWKYNASLNRIMPSEQHPTMLKRNTTTTANGEMMTVNEEGAYSFKYDSLVQPSQTAGEMYNQQIAPVVSAVTKGYNGTVFAYGQTGSGKTYTMSGCNSNNEDAEMGVIPRAIRQIFDDVEKATKREFLVRVSYLEIYNETLNDLLAALPSLSSVGGSPNDADGRPSSPIKGGSSHTVSGAANTIGSTLKMFESGGRVQIQGLREEIVTKPEQVLDLLDRGQKSRHQAATDWNERSSRSHCVFMLTVESRDKTEASCSTQSASVRLSQLNLIDLAGSERAASEKDRRKEGAFINKSLLTLGTVIAKLSEQCATGKEEAHIPYRDSKLTRLLQTSLSGNARVAVICTVSPLKEHAVESLSTLRFGQRCKMVTTSAKQGSVVDDKALIARYKRELEKLRGQLELNHGVATTIPASSSVKALHDEKAKAEREVRDMNAQRATLKQQIEHLTRLILTGKEVEAARTGDGSQAEGDRRDRVRASRRSDMGTSSPSKLDAGRLKSTAKNDDNVFASGNPGRSFAKPFAVEAEMASLRKGVAKALAAKQASEEARRREVQLWQAKVSELEEANKEAEEELDEAEVAFNKLKEERDAIRKQVVEEREMMRKQVAEEREANRLLKLVAKSRTADLTEEQRRDILSDSQRRIDGLESRLSEKEKAEARMKKEIETLRAKQGSSEEIEELKREIEDLRNQTSGNDNRSFATAADEESVLASIREQLQRVEDEKTRLEEELRMARIDQGKDEAERDFADLVGGTSSSDAIEHLKKQVRDEKAKREELALLVNELERSSRSSSASSSDALKLRRAEEKCKTLERQVERLTQDLDRSSFAQRLSNPSPPLSSAGSSSADQSPNMTEMQLESEQQKARIASLERQLEAAKAQNEEGSTLQAGPFRSSFASRLSRGGSVRQYKKYDTEAADLAGTPTGPSSSISSLDIQRAVKAERDEIERLNEVINSQRSIMADLEASVATWKKRLQLQQEIIAKLVESGLNASPSLIAQSQTIAVADTPAMAQIARRANIDAPELRRTPSTLSSASSGPYYGAHLYNKPPTPLGATAHGLGLGSTSPTKGTSWLATMPGHRPDMSVPSTDSSLTPRSINRNAPLPQPQSNARNLAAQDRRRTIDHEIASLKGSPRVESTKYRLLEPQMRSPTASPSKIGRGPLPVVPGSPPKLRPTKDWYI